MCRCQLCMCHMCKCQKFDHSYFLIHLCVFVIMINLLSPKPVCQYSYFTDRGDQSSYQSAKHIGLYIQHRHLQNSSRWQRKMNGDYGFCPDRVVKLVHLIWIDFIYIVYSICLIWHIYIDNNLLCRPFSIPTDSATDEKVLNAWVASISSRNESNSIVVNVPGFANMVTIMYIA